MAGAVARYATVAASRQARVVVDDDEVSSNEDEPLQKRFQWLSRAEGLSGSGPTPIVPDEATVTNKEAVNKRAAEEAAVMRAAKEAGEKAAVDKKAADKRTADEAAVKGWKCI
jgi:hypothetical protein